MLKEPRNEELTREEVFAEYFRRRLTGDECLTESFYEKMEKTKTIFNGKTKLELLIKGTVYFDKDFKKLFTFINKTYNITEGAKDELENVLLDLDNFKAFMGGNEINYFSEIENEYINYTRVLNAKIFIELT